MSAHRSSDIERLFQAALDCAPDQREAFLQSACAGDVKLLLEVEALLTHADAASFLERPALDVAVRAGAGKAAIRIEDRIGPYKVVAQLGAGGMGEVYRARDSLLGRDVALKLLPAMFANDPERLARFEREARVLASLNHPHIAAIYAVEAVNHALALVLELVEGPTLAERLAHGPLPIREALSAARQIADAVAAAHEHGIVHRDLKPENVKFARDGTVKVLDFGLAKPMVGDAPGPDVSNLTAVALSKTHERLIVGTVGYMSPEQATGLPTDKRTDIWAFGCVLFEMLTGRRAFEGRDGNETFAAMLLREPTWDALPAQLPGSIRRLVQRCLERDVHRRIADIAAVQFALDEIVDLENRPAAAVTRPSERPWRRRGIAVAAITLAAGAALAAGVARLFTPAAPTPVTRTTIALNGSRALTTIDADRSFALSPDGTRIVYVGNGGTQLFVRAIDALDPMAIATGTGMYSPFISPDGRWVAFFERVGELKKVRITGGTPIALATFDRGKGIWGAAWPTEDELIIASNRPATGLFAVPAGGGMPVALTEPDQSHGEAQYLWPEPLPGGRAVLFTITAQTGGFDAAQVAILNLQTRARKIVLRGGTDAQYLPSGHLVYAAAGALRAIAFDPERREVRGGTDALVLPQVVVTPQGRAAFAVAGSGTLVYLDAPGGPQAGASRTLVWVDRSGREELIPAPPRAYRFPRLSPDGTRLALDVRDQDYDIWIWDFRRATLGRLTIDPALDRTPEWTRDSRKIIFSSDRGGANGLWWQEADGSSVPERLTTSTNSQFATGTTPNGTAVLFHGPTPTRGQDLMQVSLDGSRRITPVLQTTSNESNGVVSPDGRWMAYESDRAGARAEIFVRPFPSGASEWQISNGGGARPAWAPNGRELFYVTPAPDNALMVVPVETSDTTVHASTPVRLLTGRYLASGPNRNYDVSADGRRFVMIKVSPADEAAQPSLVLVQHWDEELKRLAPVK